VPLVTASDTVLGAASGMAGWCLLVTASGHLLAHLCRVVCSYLIVGGVLSGDTTRLLERAPEEVALSALLWALLTATGQRAWAA
jgi:hypothetical protein